MHSKTLGRLRGKRSIDKRIKDTSFIFYLQNDNVIISQFIGVVGIVKNKLSALYHVNKILFLCFDYVVF